MNTRQFSERASGEDRNNIAANRTRIIPTADMATVRNACHGSHFSLNTSQAEMSAKAADVKITAHGIG